MIFSLACVLVSRLMLNLRDPRKHSVSRGTITMIATASPVRTPSTTLLQTLTKVEDVDERSTCGSRNHRGGLSQTPFSVGTMSLSDSDRQTEIEMVSIVDHGKMTRHDGA